MACGLPVIHTATGPTSEFVPADGGWAVEAERAPMRAGGGLPELAGDAYVHEVKPEALVDTLRSVAAAPDERRRRAATALARAKDYDWDRVGEMAAASLETLG